jgi:hypothetical protein
VSFLFLNGYSNTAALSSEAGRIIGSEFIYKQVRSGVREPFDQMQIPAGPSESGLIGKVCEVHYQPVGLPKGRADPEPQAWERGFDRWVDPVSVRSANAKNSPSDGSSS